MASFEKAIPVILRHEGGLVNDPDDPGGITNFGITLTWLRQFEPEANESTIRAMTRDRAAGCYRMYIWDRCGYGSFLDDTLATKVFDMGVNLGEPRAHKMLQQVANSLGCSLVADGVLGPKSYAAVNGLDPASVLTRLCQVQKDYYKAIVAKRPASQKFLAGWLARAEWGNPARQWP